MSKRVTTAKIITAAEIIGERNGTTPYVVLLNATVWGDPVRYCELMATAGNLFTSVTPDSPTFQRALEQTRRAHNARQVA